MICQRGFGSFFVLRLSVAWVYHRNLATSRRGVTVFFDFVGKESTERSYDRAFLSINVVGIVHL
jgi:hypothetical protein